MSKIRIVEVDGKFDMQIKVDFFSRWKHLRTYLTLLEADTALVSLRILYAADNASGKEGKVIREVKL